MTEQCGNCRFYLDASSTYNTCCRRFPPNARGSFSAVVNDDWCGEWQPVKTTGGHQQSGFSATVPHGHAEGLMTEWRPIDTAPISGRRLMLYWENTGCLDFGQWIVIPYLDDECNARVVQGWSDDGKSIGNWNDPHPSHWALCRICQEMISELVDPHGRLKVIVEQPANAYGLTVDDYAESDFYEEHGCASQDAVLMHRETGYMYEVDGKPIVSTDVKGRKIITYDCIKDDTGCMVGSFDWHNTSYSQRKKRLKTDFADPDAAHEPKSAMNAWVRAGQPLAGPLFDAVEAKSWAHEPAHCDLCGITLTDQDSPALNCGGTCLRCMAEVGEDPECIAAMRTGQMRVRLLPGAMTKLASMIYDGLSESVYGQPDSPPPLSVEDVWVLGGWEEIYSLSRGFLRDRDEREKSAQLAQPNIFDRNPVRHPSTEHQDSALIAAFGRR